MNVDEHVAGKAEKIKLLILDVDGVLTDGSLFFGPQGEEYKAFNSRDGHGIKLLLKSGVEVAVITARTSVAVTARMEGLGVKHIYQGQQDKRLAFNELRASLGLDTEECAYVGDDVIDLPVMTAVGLAIAVADAHPFVIEHSDCTTRLSGGRGAVREVIDMILFSQNNYQALYQPYLEKP